MNKTYHAKGLVYGNLWGGGRGAYSARPLKNFQSKKELISEAERMLKEGSLDSRMGYESLIGARLVIKEVETITQNKKNFSRSEFNVVFIGKLTQKEKRFLSSCE